jgi:hypothetical protein
MDVLYKFSYGFLTSAFEVAGQLEIQKERFDVLCMFPNIPGFFFYS